MRVLVPGVSWPLETFVERLLVGLAATGMELTLAPLWSFTRPPVEWTERHGLRWVDDAVSRTPRTVAQAAIGASGGSIGAVLRPGPLLAGTRHNRERLFGAGWDVVYAPWINVLTGDGEILRWLSAPLVTSCRGTLVAIAPWDPSRMSHREGLTRVFAAARLVHCVSHAIVHDSIGLGLDPANARVVHPAVDPTIFGARERNPPEGLKVQVLCVGTLNWIKDQEMAMVALRKAVDRGADICMDLVGDGPDRQHLQFVIDDLDLADRVRLLGRRTPEEIAERLRKADVFLHTSSSEGISNAVLEAMATGLPVVTTEAGGMREAVCDGIEGFVVQVRDADATANALVALAADPQLRNRMGAAGRQRVLQQFRLDQQIESFSALLHEAAGR